LNNQSQALLPPTIQLPWILPFVPHIQTMTDCVETAWGDQLIYHDNVA
jgi:hypothetical protein